MFVHLDDTKSIPLSELRKRREALGLSLRELASLIGVSPSWIHNIEQGRTPLLGGQYLKVVLYLRTLGLYSNPVDHSLLSVQCGENERPHVLK